MGKTIKVSTSAYVDVNIEVDLDDFDTDDLFEEALARIHLWTGGESHYARKVRALMADMAEALSGFDEDGEAFVDTPEKRARRAEIYRAAEVERDKHGGRILV